MEGFREVARTEPNGGFYATLEVDFRGSSPVYVACCHWMDGDEDLQLSETNAKDAEATFRKLEEILKKTIRYQTEEQSRV